MCLILFAYNYHREFPLIVAANRDEFYERPTAPAHNWSEEPNIYAGRDLVGGGTWLGVTSAGRFAAVTNYRDPSAEAGRRSRGSLVADFLRSDQIPRDYLGEVASSANEYSGFNLIVGDLDKSSSLLYLSNREGQIRELEPGLYGLSNHLLDTPWPKVARGKIEFAGIVDSKEFDRELLFKLLADETPAGDAALPDTGVGLEKERALSPIFIRTPIYGTRCSTVVTFTGERGFHFEERVFV